MKETSDPDHPWVRLVNAPTPLARLYAVAGVRSLLADLERQNVAALRAVRTPWAEIARALGVSRQALQQRYPDVD